jgi:hypothetical protein
MPASTPGDLAAGALWPLLAALDADVAPANAGGVGRAARPLAEVVRRLSGVPTLALLRQSRSPAGGGAALPRRVTELPIASVVASNTRDADHGAAQVLSPGAGCWASALGRVGSLTATLLSQQQAAATGAADVAGLLIDLPPDMLPERIEVELGVEKRAGAAASVAATVAAALAESAPLAASAPGPVVGGKRELGGGTKQPSPPPPPPAQPLQPLFPGLASLRAELGITTSTAAGGAPSSDRRAASAAPGSATSGSAGSFTTALQSPRGSSAAASSASPPSPASSPSTKPPEIHWYPAARLTSSAVSQHMVVTALSPAPPAALAAGGIVPDGDGGGSAAYATHVRLTLTGHAPGNTTKAVGVTRLQVLGRQRVAAVGAASDGGGNTPSLAALLSGRATDGDGDDDGGGSSDALSRVVGWVARVHDAAAAAAAARNPHRRRLARIQDAVRSAGAGATDALVAALAPPTDAPSASTPICLALDAFTAVACALGCRLAVSPPLVVAAGSAGAADASAAFTLPPLAAGGAVTVKAEEKDGGDTSLLRALHTLAAQLRLQLHVDAATRVVTATAPQATAAEGATAAAALAKLLGVPSATAADVVVAPRGSDDGSDDGGDGGDDAYLSDSSDDGGSGDDDAAADRHARAPAAAADVALTSLAGLLHAVRATGSAAGLVALASALLARPPLPVTGTSPARAAGAALLHALRQRALALRRAVGAAEYCEDARGRGQAPSAGPSYGPIAGAVFDKGRRRPHRDVRVGQPLARGGGCGAVHVRPRRVGVQAG